MNREHKQKTISYNKSKGAKIIKNRGSVLDELILYNDNLYQLVKPTKEYLTENLRLII